MAVTERFREIGTYKCLGALDSFIVAHLRLGSDLPGIVGRRRGGIVGILVGTVSLVFKFGLQWYRPGRS